jgi:hypothetical protein
MSSQSSAITANTTGIIERIPQTILDMLHLKNEFFVLGDSPSKIKEVLVDIDKHSPRDSHG